MWKLIAIPLAAALFTGCASDVYVPYPYPTGADTGRVIISFTEPMETVNVLIDGSLLAEDEYTERVEIQDVPVGEREIEIVASEGWRTHSVHHVEVVTVGVNRDETILINTPPYSSGYWVYRAVVWLVAMAPVALSF